MNKQKVEQLDEKHEVRTVSMYPSQWAVVEEINRRYGFRSVSNALRFIIDDYWRITGHNR